ncbi:50S ribosomal protein L30 [Ignavibacteria bacterium]|nr:50S ribosomal protein L30 [Bacteroidota bacterium]MCZ2132886.1 50S ribosomal protein L30 [Bacteroidota bacterium]
MEKVRITQVRSIIKTKENQKLTIKALGLGRPNYSVEHQLTPQIAGMINTVKHLVKVEKL